MANSRLAARASFFAEVDVLSPSDAMPQRLWGKDLSEAGIFLQTTRPYHPGDRLSLRFDVPGSQVHVRAAEVVWVKRFEPINVDGSLPGIGVRFLSMDPPARAAIRRYVQSMAPAQNDDVPTPPPHAELSDESDLESLRPLTLPPLTLPPFEALSLPPFDSIAPMPAFEQTQDESALSTDENLGSDEGFGSLGDERFLLSDESFGITDERFVFSDVEDESAAASTDEDREEGHDEDRTVADVMAGDFGALSSEEDELLAALTPRSSGSDAWEKTLPSDVPAPALGVLEDPEHPLAGWRFEIVREPAGEARFDGASEVSGPTTADLMPSPDAVTLKPRSVTLPPSSAFAREDVAGELAGDVTGDATGDVTEPSQPAPSLLTLATSPSRSEKEAAAPSSLEPHDEDSGGFAGQMSSEGASRRSDEASFELSGPGTPLGRLDLSFEDEPQERGPDVLALAAHTKVDRDFFEGKLAVVELPRAEERGYDAERTRKLRIAWAAGLLLAGGALGVAVGYEPAPEVVMAAPALEKNVAMLPAPKPVAEVEKELLAATLPVEESARAEKPAKESAPKASATQVAAAAAPAPKPAASSSTGAEAEAPSVPFVSPAEVATSAPGKLPRKEDTALTSAAPTATATKAADRPAGVVVEYGRVTLPLEGGRVARSFGLANPARVVVDLVDAELPKNRSEEIGEKGIARVRFGRPDPTHVRVVVELAGTDAPTGITTLKKGSTLSVAWR